MTTRDVIRPVALALAVSISHAVSAGVAFSDGSFPNASWTATKILDTTVGSAATFSAGQVLAGGNPGLYRSNQINFSYNGTATNQGITVANMFSGFAYTPSVSGAINSLSYTVDSEVTETGGSPAVDLGLLLFQGGHYYARYPQIPTTTWITTKESSLVSNSFTLVGSTGPTYPDFSTNGTTIQFGYITYSAISSGSAKTITANVGADNFSLTMTNTPTPFFSSEAVQNSTNAAFTLSGLAPGESITWLASTNLSDWVTNSVNSATDTNFIFTVTNAVGSGTNHWFLRALVQ